MDDLELDKNVRDEIRAKLREYFNGKIVREDLTKKIKEGANVPVYVLEYLLGQYCNSEDEEIIQDGVETVKKILASNYVRPDEAQKVLSLLREQGTHTIIDMVSVALNIKKDRYEASFSNLGLTGIPIGEEFPTKYDRLLAEESGALSVSNMHPNMSLSRNCRSSCIRRLPKSRQADKNIRRENFLRLRFVL